MRREDKRPAYKRSVFASKLPDSVKVLLLLMVEHMDHRLYVSVPRNQLAERLGVAPARISERVKVARDRGYLQQVRRGRPGVTAVYQGVPKRGTDSVPLEVRPPVPSRGTDPVPLSGGLEVRQDHTQVGNAAATLGTHREGNDRNGAGYERAAGGDAAPELTDPWWLREPPDHADREASA